MDQCEDGPHKVDELTAMLEDAQASMVDAEAERDALAAHVGRLHRLLDELPDVMPVTPHLPMARVKGDYLERVDVAVSDAPSYSLARLKAQWQADALENHAKAISRDNDSDDMISVEDVHDMLLADASKLRRQAEEG